MLRIIIPNRALVGADQLIQGREIVSSTWSAEPARNGQAVSIWSSQFATYPIMLELIGWKRFCEVVTHSGPMIDVREYQQ